MDRGRAPRRPADDRPVTPTGCGRGMAEGGHPDLERWAANVGPPVALDLAPSPPAPRLSGLTVICWNLGIGTGRLDVLLRRLNDGDLGRAVTPGGEGPVFDGEWPLVILAQEAYRAGDDVPARPVGEWHGGPIRARGRTDIAEAARAAGLSLRYYPSMRNGSDRSDRGNAVLSTLPVTASRAFALPHVRQRRIAVGSQFAGVAGLEVVTAHLDTRGRTRRTVDHVGGFGGGRSAQAAALAARLGDAGDRCAVLGADLNSYLGVRDPAMLTLVRAGLHPAARRGQWWHTFHGPLPLLLDHVLYRSPSRRIASACVTRLDEAPGDRTRRVFGSDHHPLLARIQFRVPDAAAA
jgi:endonuclease/exonuclease/phosphatase family metal-dependent hydrolase